MLYEVITIFTGIHLVQGIMAALYQREKTGKGAKIEVSLLESTLDIQFEVITTYLNDGNQLPQRAKQGSAHAYLAAPYGIYPTSDGYLALALNPLDQVTKAMNLTLPEAYTTRESWFTHRDEIMAWLAGYFKKEPTRHWLSIFEPLDLRCSDVFTYRDLLNHEAYKVLQMDQEVETSDGITMRTTRCPIRIDGQRIFSRKSAPKPGEDNARIEKEFKLL